jgi:hypothetical protein
MDDEQFVVPYPMINVIGIARDRKHANARDISLPP